MLLKFCLQFLLAILLCLPWALPAVADKEQGIALLRQGRYKEAIESLRQTQKISSSDSEVKDLLAASYLAQGLNLLRQEKLAEAMNAFSAGYELEPENGQFSFHIAHILFRQGSLGQAESFLHESLRQSGPLPDIYRLLAKICYGQGRLHEAKSYLEQVLETKSTEEGSRKFLEKIERELAIEEKMGRRHGGNFQISYVAGGEELGSETMDVLQDAYAELGTLFNAFPEPAVTVILYGNRDFAAVTGAPGWASGAYDGKIRVPIGGLRQMNDQLRRILYHEYAHVLIFFLTRGNVPRWLDEGLAQIAEGEEADSQIAYLREAGKGVGLIPLSRLESSFAGLSGKEAAAAYLQTRVFTHYLLDRYGWPRMLDLLQSLGSGEDFPAAVRLLLYEGEDFARIRQEWQKGEGMDDES